jgi:hypothetical protein
MLFPHSQYTSHSNNKPNLEHTYFVFACVPDWANIFHRPISAAFPQFVMRILIIRGGLILSKNLFVMTCVVGIIVLTACGGKGNDKQVSGINADNAVQMVELITYDVGVAFSYAFNPDETQVAIATDSGLHLLDITSGTATDYFSDVSVYSPTYNADGTMIAISTGDDLRILDIAADTTTTYLADKNVYRPTFSPDGMLIAALDRTCSPGSCTGNVYVVNLETGEEVFSLPVDGYITHIAFSPVDMVLAVSFNQTSRASLGTQYGTNLSAGTLKAFEFGSGEERFTINEEDAIYGSFFFSADGKQLAYSTMAWSNMNPSPGSGVFHLIKMDKGEKVKSIETDGLVSDLSADWSIANIQSSVIWGNTISFGTQDSIVPIIYVDSDTAVTTLEAYSRVLIGLDSTVAFVTDDDLESTVSVRNVETGDEIIAFTVEGAERVVTLTLSPQGNMLAARWSNDDEQQLTIWGLPAKTAK